MIPFVTMQGVSKISHLNPQHLIASVSQHDKSQCLVLQYFLVKVFVFCKRENPNYWIEDDVKQSVISQMTSTI